jgi:hypothetical protein
VMNATPDDVLRAKYVIGLDIGDGESALVWSSTGHTPRATVYRRQRTAESSILTAFSRQAGRYLFGEEAVLAEGAVQFRVNFKGHKQTIEAMQFGKELLGEFFEANPDVQENCLIFVGHPAGWPASVVAEYSSYLDHLGPSVHLLAESQSALIHVRDRSSRRHESLGNVLVVDIGSSTVDFTVVEDMIPRNIAVGADLGCSQIDRRLAAMAKTALAGNAEFVAALTSSGGEDLLLLACRRAKEAQFSGSMPSLLDNRSSHNPNHAAIADFGFGWLRGQEIPSLIMQPGDWASKFEQLIIEVKKQLPRPPTTVILTGGGSRMPFARNICQRAFPEAVVDRDSDPSLSVARGLASAGRQRVRIARFRRDFRAIVTSDETRAHIRAQIENAFKMIKDAIGVEMRNKDRAAWPDLITDPPKQEQIVRDLQSSISAYLVPRAQKVCAEYGIDDRHFSINLTLPPLFAARIVKSISRAAKSSRLPGNIASNAFTVLAGQAALRRKLTPDRRTLYSFIVWVAIDAGQARYLRQRAIKNVLIAELPPEATEPLIDEILTRATGLMDERASAVERFVT